MRWVTDFEKYYLAPALNATSTDIELGCVCTMTFEKLHDIEDYAGSFIEYVIHWMSMRIIRRR